MTVAAPPKRTRELVTMAEYARMRDCSRAAVTKAAARKQIHLVDGLVDPVDADKTWPRIGGPPGAGTSKVPGKTKDPPVSPPSPRVEKQEAVPPSNGNGSRPDYWDERANHERLKARLAELEIAQLEGKLLEAKQVELQVFEAYRLVRDALLTVPDRIAPKLAGDTDAASVHRIMTAEIRQALNELDARLRPPD